MADNAREFKIRITGDCDSVVASAQQASGALQEVTPAAQAGAAAVTETAKAGEHAFASHKDWRFAVKGLKEDFPELAHVARMALHPITLVVAGLGGAWEIWNQRIEATTALFAQFEMPDATGLLDAGHISAAAEAWKQYGDKVKDALASIGGVEKQTSQILSNLDQALKRQKEIISSQHAAEEAKRKAEEAGQPQGATAYQQGHGLLADIEGKRKEREAEMAGRQAKIDVKRDEALELELEAVTKEREAKSIHVMDEKGEADVSAKYAKEKEDAIKAIKDDRERAHNFAEYLDESKNAPWANTQELLTGKTAEELHQIAIERMRSNQEIVDRANHWERGLPGRADRRSRRSKLFGESAEAGAQAEGIGAEAANEQSNLDKDRTAGKRTGMSEELRAGYAALAAAKSEQSRLNKEISSQIEATGDAATALKQSSAETRKLIEMLVAWMKELQSQQANLRNR